MTINTITTTIGWIDIGHFIGEGECQIQFTYDQINALYFASTFSESLANAFVNFCLMTFSSGDIPSCFRQDLPPEAVEEIKNELPIFHQHFGEALFNLTLIFDNWGDQEALTTPFLPPHMDAALG